MPRSPLHFPEPISRMQILTLFKVLWCVLATQLLVVRNWNANINGLENSWRGDVLAHINVQVSRFGFRQSFRTQMCGQDSLSPSVNLLLYLVLSFSSSLSLSLSPSPSLLVPFLGKALHARSQEICQKIPRLHAYLFSSSVKVSHC